MKKILFVDQCTHNRARLSFTRILIEIDINGEFLNNIVLNDEFREKFIQKVVYK